MGEAESCDSQNTTECLDFNTRYCEKEGKEVFSSLHTGNRCMILVRVGVDESVAIFNCELCE